MVTRAVNETTVVYKAIADFSALKQEAREAKKEVNDLDKAYQDLNKNASAKNKTVDSQDTQRVKNQAAAIEKLSQAYADLSGTSRLASDGLSDNAQSLDPDKYEKQKNEVKGLKDEYKGLSTALSSVNKQMNTQQKRLTDTSSGLSDYVDYSKLAKDEQLELAAATEETNKNQRGLAQGLKNVNSALTSQNSKLSINAVRMETFTKRSMEASEGQFALSVSTDESTESFENQRSTLRDFVRDLNELRTLLPKVAGKKVSKVQFEQSSSGGGTVRGPKTADTPVFEIDMEAERKTDAYARAIDRLKKKFKDYGEEVWEAAYKEQRLIEMRRKHNQAISETAAKVGKAQDALRRMSNQDDGTLKRTFNWIRQNRAFTSTNSILDKIKDGLKELSSIRITFTPTLPVFTALVTVLGSAINPLVAGVAALGAGVFGLASNLGSLIGNLALAVPALFAFGGVIASLVLGFNGMGDALKAGLDGDLEKYEEALSKLSPAAQSVTRSLVDQAGAWKEVRSATQEALFAPMQDSMDEIVKLAPSVQKFLTGIANALGRVGARAIALSTSSRWLRNIESLGDTLGPVVEDLGDGFVNILDSLLTIAEVAAPILGRLTKGFEEWTNSVRIALASGQTDNSLYTYLDKVYQRLEQWGRIVGNTAETLFNYGKAAEPFGQWMTNGLEGLTEGWLTSSEKAAEAGSPFRKYLEDIKPLLSDVGGLIGDFFGWFTSEAAETDNIQGMRDLIALIRDDLGPNLADLFDTLADTDIDEAFVKAISALVGLINSILKNGGAEVLNDIANFIADFATGAADLAEEEPGLTKALVQFGVFIGILMAAGPVIGTLSGIFGMMSKISKLVAPKGWGGIFGGAGAGAAKGAGKHAGAAPAGGIGSWWSGLFGGGAKEAGKHAAPKGGLTGLLQGAGKGAAQGGKGGIIGLIAGLGLGGLAGVSGATNADQAEKNSKKGGDPNFQQSWWDKMLNGSTYVGDEDWYKEDTKDLDLKQKMEYDKGLAPGQTATKEGSIANLGGLLPKDTDWSNFGTDEAVFPEAATWLEEQETAIETFFTGIGESIGTWAGDIWTSITGPDSWLATTWEGFVTWFEGLPEDIATWAGDVWNGIQDVGTWISEQWTLFTDWFTGLPEDIATWAGDVWNNIQSAATWLGERLTELSDWVTDLPGKFGEWAGDVWNDIAGPDTWLGQRLTDLQTWVQGLPGKFGEWAGNIWNNIQNAGTWLGQRLSEFRNWATGIPGQIGSWLSGIWNGIPGIGNRLSEIGSSVWSWARQIPHDVASAIGNLFKFVSGSFSMGFNVGGLVRTPSKKVGGPGSSGVGKRIGRNHGGPIQKRNRGGVLHRANGGGRDGSSVVPGSGNVDKVPAMLTPGEFVIRKAVTSRIGIENLTKLNSGVISYGDMLRQAIEQKRVNSGADTASMSFLNGGGMVPSTDMATANARNTSNQFGGSPTSTVIENRGTTIGQVVINNPEPETASTSLPKAIRRSAYKS